MVIAHLRAGSLSPSSDWIGNWTCCMGLLKGKNENTGLETNRSPEARARTGDWSRGGTRAPPPPSLFLDQTEARRTEKSLGETGPPFIQGSGWPPPSPPLSQGLDAALRTIKFNIHCSSRRFLLSSLLLCQWRPLDSRTRTTTSTRFDWKFFRLKWKK